MKNHMKKSLAEWSNPLDLTFRIFLGLHRIENIGAEELIFIEIQLGEDLIEDDIVRLEDDYGRV